MDAVDSIEMKAKIVDAEASQVIMKACNKIVRSKKLLHVEKVDKLITEQNFQLVEAEMLLKPDFAGVVGYPSWKLSNNSANIRRMKQRVVELERNETTSTSEEAFDGGIIVNNAEDDRVQIDFDEKPGDIMRAALRGEGWRWAPSMKLWQRKRTLQALVSAKRIVGVL